MYYYVSVTTYLAMYLAHTLKQPQGRSLQKAKSYQLLYDIFNGLSYLHTAKVIHLNFT